MKTNAKISVFNKYTDDNKNVIFKKHVIENVFWDDSKAVSLERGYQNDDNVNLFIPKSQNDMSGYVKPKQYNGLKDTWTLKNSDYVVKGEVAENEVLGIKDFSKYDDVFVINLVDDKDFGSKNMQHFEVRGK